MIVRVELNFRDGNHTMLFGDSYKKWHTQFEEYCRQFKPLDINRVELSISSWKGWGGLKWCNESEFQNELNTEGCQTGEVNKNPRLYSDMHFEFDNKTFDKAYNILIKYSKI